MRIHVFTVCWNERPILPYFLRHYGEFCEKIVVYDNGSDDGSQDLITAHPAGEVRVLESGGEFREDVTTGIKDSAWKEAAEQPDWVVVCDMDEFLYHPRMLEFLAECKEQQVTIPTPTGWQMVHDRFPQTAGQIYEEVRKGFIEPSYGKPAIFDPTAITAMNYTPGCHKCEPHGRVKYRSDPALKLLHLKYLGLDYLTARYRALRARMGAFNRTRGYGHQYSWDGAKLGFIFTKYRIKAQEVPFGESSNAKAAVP